MATLEYRQRVRRDTAANFTLYNPTLLLGELALETDTKKMKIGDGVTAWAGLDYDILTLADVGVAGGLVPLNEFSKIDASYIDQVATASTTAFTPSGSLSSTDVQAAIEELDTEKLTVTGIRTAGCVVLPSFTNNLDGTITIGAGQYALYANQNYSGVPITYTIGSSTLVVPDGVDSYVLASYNGGSPTLEIVTGVPAVNTTDSDRIPVFSMFRSGLDIHHFDWDHLSLGLAEKLNKRFRRTDRFHIDSGLALTETPTRVISIAAGSLWAGANLIELDATDSSNPDTHFYYHTAGAWARGTLTQYDNTQYDDGTNLATLSNGRYAVNWVYRSVQPSGGLYILLGNGNYTLAQAQGSSEPPKPIEIASQAKLLGRIIVAKGDSIATQIDKVSDVTFTSSTAANHNDLGAIQGGSADQHYHMTSAEYTGTGTGIFVRQTTPDIRFATTTQSGNYTALLSDYTIRASGTATQTITLPDATTCSGKVYNIKKVGATSSQVVLDAFNTQLIDGSLTAAINVPFQNLTVQSNGTGWDII